MKKYYYIQLIVLLILTLSCSAVRAGSITLHHSHDKYGRYTGLSLSGLPGTYSITYGYDKSTGRLNSVGWNIEGFSGILSYSYLPKSDLLHQLQTNELLITYSYEPHRNIRTQIRNGYGANLISQYDYKYDDLGRRTSVVNRGQAFNETTFNSYKYNDRNELEESARYSGADIFDTGNPVNHEYRAYTYDSIGNRKESVQGDDTTVYTVNSLNQYEQMTGHGINKELIFDSDGNLTSVSDGTTEIVYHYDGENRLVVAEPANPSSGDRKIEFLYDYLGRRVRKQIYIRNASDWKLDTEKLFLYKTESWHMIREWTIRGEEITLKSYIWGLDITHSLEGAGGIGGLIACVDHSLSEIYFYLYDSNGNVCQIIDSGGNIVAKYEYDPYGRLIKTEGYYADQNPFRFSTKYYDTETGLIYYGDRYYSQELGRWTTRDPLGEIGGLNLYSAVNNDFINSNDVNGLFILRLASKAAQWAGKNLAKRLIKKKIRDELKSQFKDLAKDYMTEELKKVLDDAVSEIIEDAFRRGAVEEASSWIPGVGLIVDIIGTTKDICDLKSNLKEYKNKLNKITALDWDAVVPKKGKYKGQHRKDHVRLHNTDNPSKPQHGVFFGDGVDITNEAWVKAQLLGLKPDSTGTLRVPMDKIVGRSGGQTADAGELFYFVEIKVVPRTNQIITAYPAR